MAKVEDRGVWGVEPPPYDYECPSYFRPARAPAARSFFPGWKKRHQQKQHKIGTRLYSITFSVAKYSM
jgi:hypothetical protein